MKFIIPKTKHLISLSLIIIIIANFYIFQNTILGIIFGLSFLYIYGNKLGSILFSNFDQVFKKIMGTFSLLLIYTALYWVAFYLQAITNIVFVLTIIILPIIIEYLYYRKDEFITFEIKSFLKKFSLRGWFYSSLYVIFMGIFFYLITSKATSEAIYSPWDLISKKIFLFFTIATFLLIKLIFAYKNRFSLLFIIIHFFAVSSVAFFVYKLGYGYDPFLHFAAIKNILTTGIIEPKPFYYIGEYSLIIYLHHLTLISVDFLNKLLLPLLFSIITPTVIYYSLRSKFNWTVEVTQLILMFFLILPVTFFINTTPQGLTNLLAIIIIFTGIIPRNKLDPKFNIFLAIATCMIHPLFGAPLLIFTFYNYLNQLISQSKLKIAFNTLTICGTIIIFPLLFLLNSLINHQKISLTLNQFQLQGINLNIQMNALYDFIYTYINNYQLILLGLALVAIIFLIIKKDYYKNKITNIFAIAFLINFIFVKYFIKFDFTISANQADFEERILLLAIYFILPTIFYFFYYLIKKTQLNSSRSYKYFAIIFLIIICNITLYISYPVHDNYQNTKSFNVSQADLDTVNLIDDLAYNEYIVLSNQLVAAAAIHEFGFANYYNNEFYYSIPNSNKKALYLYYKKMIFDYPSKHVANEAMDMAEVNQLFFVVNPYWTNAKYIIEEAKKSADQWTTDDNNINYIFIYNR